MRVPLIAGNWKMHTDTKTGADLLLALRTALKSVDSVEVVIAPPFTSLYHLSHLIAGTNVRLAAQDMHWEQSGAFTGEVSAAMLKDAGCTYVIIGHSERRALFNETDETVNKKAHSAVKAGLRPIICVGETLSERDSGKALDRVGVQLTGALRNFSSGALRDVTIAYEPVWAIGTGRVATPEQAEEVHAFIRERLHEEHDKDAVDSVRILYGGSVKPDNIDSLMAQPDIDGALVGGASLKAEDFCRIVMFQKA